MTVLGEYALPRSAAVWTSTLVDVLALLGIEEKSARQALARTAAEGWLAALREGRRVQWNLTGPGRRMLSEGASRIYSFGSEELRWDRRWLVLLVTVPEAKRELRHRLRTQLAWAGFGSPAAGVWVTPDASREDEARQILADLGLAEQSMSFAATYGSIGRVESVARQAWELDTVAARYDDFVAKFEGLRPAAGDEMLVAQTLLVHEWRRFPFLDPGLPRELLPARWSGITAARLFHGRHAEWRAGAQQRWAERADEANGTDGARRAPAAKAPAAKAPAAKRADGQTRLPASPRLSTSL
jgi:phenylacetic acid degradation operon negative regulatory protein